MSNVIKNALLATLLVIAAIGATFQFLQNKKMLMYKLPNKDSTHFKKEDTTAKILQVNDSTHRFSGATTHVSVIAIGGGSGQGGSGISIPDRYSEYNESLWKIYKSGWDRGYIAGSRYNKKEAKRLIKQDSLLFYNILK